MGFDADPPQGREITGEPLLAEEAPLAEETLLTGENLLSEETLASATWHNLRQIFDQAMELPEGRRGDFLETACGDDLRLLTIVRDLVRQDQSSTWLRQGVEDNIAETFHLAKAGDRLGPYRLGRRIGQGGMGAVFKAAREDGEFAQEVAIKIVGQGPLTPELRRRFLVERQILARLQHPNICRLLDGGTSPEGTPYLAMELISGQSITAWAETNSPDPESCLALFEQVCEAVEYAHRNLIVHRDLKPSNILVTAEGKVKLLDFGIAKLLHPDEGSEGHTRPEQRPLTPGYASPEQILGLPVTPAADVWALGVLLYELLVGHRPFAVENRNERRGSAHEMAWMLSGDPPPLASVAARRASGGQRWNALRRRDLDAILHQALAHAPAERYPTAGRLAEDLLRHRQELPVRAARRGAFYLTSKALRRNRLAVLVSLLVTAALLISAWAVWTAREKALVAQSFSSRAKELEDSLRFIHMLPSHNIQREVAALKGRVQNLESEALKRGGTALGPGLYAAGRLRQLLEDSSTAIADLERAWNGGYQVPGVATALGIAYAERYRVERQAAMRESRQETRRRMLAKARRRWATPAMEWLQKGEASVLVPPDYGRALLAFADDDLDTTQHLANSLLEERPWLYEAALLAADSKLVAAHELSLAKGTGVAQAEFQTAEDAYRLAVAIAPSAPQVRQRLCNLGNLWLQRNRFNPTSEFTADEFDRVLGECRKVLQLDPDYAETYSAMVDLLILRAQYARSHGQVPWPWFEQADSLVATWSDRENTAKAHLLRGRNLDAWAWERQALGFDPEEQVDHGLRLVRDPIVVAAAPAQRRAAWRLQARLHHSRFQYHRQRNSRDAESAIEAWGQALDEALSLARGSDEQEIQAILDVGQYYSSRGTWARDQGEDARVYWNRALDAYRQASALEPMSAFHWSRQATIANSVSHYAVSRQIDPSPWLEPGIAAANRALELRPAYPAALYQLGKLYHFRAHWLLVQGLDPSPDLERSLEALQRGDPARESASSLVNIAMVHRKAAEWAWLQGRGGESDLALADLALDQAFAVEPGLAYIDKQRSANLIARARAALEHGDNPRPWIAKGRELASSLTGLRKSRDLGTLDHLEADLLLREGADPEPVWRRAEASYQEAIRQGSDWAMVPIGLVDIALARARRALDHLEGSGGAELRAAKEALGQAQVRLRDLLADTGEIPSSHRLRAEVALLASRLAHREEDTALAEQHLAVAENAAGSYQAMRPHHPSVQTLKQRILKLRSP